MSELLFSNVARLLFKVISLRGEKKKSEATEFQA